MEEKEKINIVYKNIGETPLECISRMRREGNIPYHAKATYAGRLDPMAEGVLVILVGDAVHEKEMYLRLDKEYTVEILFGISTDTGDVLGKINATATSDSYSLERLEDILAQCQGIHTEEYPVYSSKTIGGKPSFSFARLGALFARPIHTVTIHSITLENTRVMSMKDVVENVLSKIGTVQGDFRQKEISSVWNDCAVDHLDEIFYIATIRVTCGSGAYMRVLAEKIGRLLGSPALAYSIVRTRVGNFSICKKTY